VIEDPYTFGNYLGRVFIYLLIIWVGYKLSKKAYIKLTKKGKQKEKDRLKLF